ncbi:hypothetical protein ACFX13_004510 [Malus domestica]
MVEVASHSAQGTMVAAHNPMRKEEVLRLMEAVDTMAGDEVELANHSEALELQNCTWSEQKPKETNR